ncbi:Golgi complex subunit 2 [Seminavis robusta]|uniref:Golgi complex subunit 2 n=1 Tax=Seminavis robusta TaxID=568900 RepID=A0A9N8DSX1_9STRA|nr:Golgi complex subunit 2 [Seminavis robusta]|eukprot:Sro332_g119370.1 Golgi complex subunit 2 (894) ;mRNA; f:50787-53639
MTDNNNKNLANGSGNHATNQDKEEMIVAMPTSGLESKLKTLREKSNQHSQILTQKLASSQSGQNLLHIGTSLSSLPPDLHSLLTQLHPVLSAAETTEQQQIQKLQALVQHANEIRAEQRRMVNAADCAELYQDLLAAERDVKRDANIRRNAGNNKTARFSVTFAAAKDDEDGATQEDSKSIFGGVLDELDHVMSLERAAHTTLCLVKDLQSSNAQVTAMTTAKATGTNTANNPDSKGASATSGALPSLRAPLEDDTERAQLLLKLAPRIRRLEADSITSLSHRMENVLNRFQILRERDPQDGPVEGESRTESELLIMLGHSMRGLALLGRGKEVESVFARVAIMPLIRSKVSMGRLDEGGSRGECAGLFSLMDDIATSITKAFGPVLRLVESMFHAESMPGTTEAAANSMMGVDLVTAGVWVPIATALMADAGIKMAIFSPGIASILQANYLALDTFLAELAERLLVAVEASNGGTEGRADACISLNMNVILEKSAIQAAQDRIYLHPKTAEFSKKWNLPIYYQLRFGESCNRLNKAVTTTQREGWIADVFAGPPEDLEKLKNQAGFELPLFLELYDILLGLWRPDVILRPLTHRFLRGAIQLVGRTISFISEGMEGKIKFGEIPPEETNNGTKENGQGADSDAAPVERPLARKPYSWGESEGDVGAVAWELTILESTIAHEYVDTVVGALSSRDTSETEQSELRNLAAEVLKETSEQINPLIDSAWNTYIVNILTSKCSNPLAAVKGVAATYRMTNRPPPTMASPFVGTILRPLKEFQNEFESRTPDRVGSKWREQIIMTVADRYSVAVDELIQTVARTEVALKNRKAKRAAVGGMSDGEKVKLQLFLDYKAFTEHVREVGVDPTIVKGVDKLKQLTVEAEALLERQRNGGK